MDPLAAHLEKQFAVAKQNRAQFEPLINDCLALGLPAAHQLGSEAGSPPIDIELFDDSGVIALSEYGSRVQAGVMPRGEKWSMLEVGSEYSPEDRQAINADLEGINDYMFEEIFDSNLVHVAHSAFINMGISTGCLMVDPGPESMLHHQAVPMHESWFVEDPWGELTGMFRRRKIMAGHIPALWPNFIPSDRVSNMIANEADKMVAVTEFFSETGSPIAKAVARSRHVVYLSEGVGNKQSIIVDETEEGLGSSPMIAFRFSGAAGEVMGRGPFMNALATVRTMNKVWELTLTNAAMALAPMFHVDDNSEINVDAIQVVPGAIIPRRAGTRGLEPIQMGRQEYSLARLINQDGGVRIRRAMFNDMLSDPNRTPATATEVAERTADLAHRTSAHFGRMHFELIRPYIRRALWIAEKRKAIELPTFKGARIRARAVSPLAKALEQGDVQRLMQYHQVVAGILGPQIASAQYDEAGLLYMLRDRMMQPSQVFMPLEQVGQKIAALLAAQAGGAPMTPPQAPQQGAV